MISAPTTAAPIVIGQMKRAISKCAGRPIWQKGFYDHIIHTEPACLRIWRYIETNPAKGREDCDYED